MKQKLLNLIALILVTAAMTMSFYANAQPGVIPLDQTERDGKKILQIRKSKI